MKQDKVLPMRELMRMKTWSNAFNAATLRQDINYPITAAAWADQALKAFDETFPKETDNESTVREHNLQEH